MNWRGERHSNEMLFNGRQTQEHNDLCLPNRRKTQTQPAMLGIAQANATKTRRKLGHASISQVPATRP